MVRVMLGTGLALAACAFSAAGQGNTASQVITLGVLPVIRLEVSSNPGSLVIRREGEEAASVRDATTRYSLLSNLDHVRISASISEPLPAGMHLKVWLEAKNGRSRGGVDISQALSPKELVADIRCGNEKSQCIVYDFSADAGGANLPLQSRVITLTVTE
jgi:hypothetical protein